MSIAKDLAQLKAAGIISEETAERIIDYYDREKKPPLGRLLLVFGVLGAILVGLGIILIIAHNWDELSRSTKSIIAFIPLLIGQIICAYVLIKKKSQAVWTESSAVFLFFAVGACISLISQIYNIPGNLSSFLFTWMLLCLPLVYIMRSSMSSLLYIAGITYYACESGYWTYPSAEPYDYWMLLLAILPFYYWIYKDRESGNALTFHHWFVPLSLIITLGISALKMEELMVMAYFCLFGILTHIGDSAFLLRQKLRNNGYKILGNLGTVVLLLAMSFSFYWDEVHLKYYSFDELFSSPEVLLVLILSITALILNILKLRSRSISEMNPFGAIYLMFIFTFLLMRSSFIAVIIMNLLALGLGLYTIKKGADRDDLGILNFGLLIITALVVCRFFDTELSFVIRGLLFIGLGAGFFATNYWMLKKRKAND